MPGMTRRLADSKSSARDALHIQLQYTAQRARPGTYLQGRTVAASCLEMDMMELCGGDAEGGGAD